MMEQISQGRVRPLPTGEITSGTIDMIHKMMRRNPKKRPTSSQLVLCPVLITSIAKVYLNVGRIEKSMMLSLDVFKKVMTT